MDAIEIGGSRYIKADDAGRLTGYATDYIGQLSRSGKISAKRIGRMWYVSEDEVVAHKKGNGRSNKQKTRQALHQKIEETTPGQIHHVFLTPYAHDSEVRRRVLETSIRYEQDASPLAPSFIESNPHDASADHELRLTEAVSITPQVPPQELKEASDAEDASEILEREAHEPRTSPEMGSYSVSMRKIRHADIEEEALDSDQNSSQVAVAERETRNRPQSRPQALTRSPLTHIPRPPRAIVPLGSPSYALGRPLVRTLVPLALVLGFVFTLSTVFLEHELVYQQGNPPFSYPSYRMSYGVTSFSSVQASVSEGVSEVSLDILSEWMSR